MARKTEFRKCKEHGSTLHSQRVDGYFQCLKCDSKRNGKKQRTFKQRCVDEVGGKCSVCGYDAYVGALEFHHIDPRQKLFGINSRTVNKKWDAVLAEIDKCILLCSNCHKEVHGGITKITDKREEWECQRLITSEELDAVHPLDLEPNRLRDN